MTTRPAQGGPSAHSGPGPGDGRESTRRPGSRIDRLSPLDLSNLRVEARGLPMHVAALAVLDGAALLDDSGTLRLDAVRRHVEERSRQEPRLRQVLTWPNGPRRLPAWADDPAFDISRHVLACRVPEPGDEAALLELACELNRPALDRDRPLWEMWLLTGLADGMVGLLVRLHHVIVDGVAALELLSAVLDLSPVPSATAPAPAVPALPATAPRTADVRSLLSSGIRRVHALEQQGRMLARLGRAPSLPWNRPVGSRRTVTLLRADLAAVKDVAHRHGGKVNDVVLTAVAGGARRLLESRGVLTPRLEMHVAVPTSIRRPGESGGNRVAIRIVPVPLDERDAQARLDVITRRTAEQRRWPPYRPGGRLLQRWMVRVMHHQRMVNLVVSNVAGPPVPVYFAGARLRQMFQLTPLQGNLGLGIGVISYDGHLNLEVATDTGLVPDVEVFMAGVTEALEQLGVAALHALRPEQPERGR